jgi:hypothetical protein
LNGTDGVYAEGQRTGCRATASRLACIYRTEHP